MKSTDVPFLKESLMADPKLSAASKSADDKSASSASHTSSTSPKSDDKAKPAEASLAPAGGSSDPTVHKLLADRQAALMNVEAAAPKVDDEKLKAAQAELAAVDEELAKLGVTAK